jgi:aerobic carbon-monoxide dehydrogenase large subunit
LSDNAARDLVAETEMGFDDAHRITAYRVRVRSNLGAYNSQFAQFIQSTLFSRVLTGAYDIPLAAMETEGFFTNTTPVDAYRGAGRPEAILTLERTIDHAARVLGVDPFALREANMIRAFPYAMMNGETIQDGDFLRVLKRLKAETDVEGYPARCAESAARGLRRGIGLAFYIESILGDPSETANVVFRADGTVALHVGTQSNGQGHETVYPRLLAERTGIPEDRIVIVQGDSDAIPVGGGTGGSRSVTLQGSAIHTTAGAMVAAFAAFLEEDMGEGVAFGDGTFGAPGSNRRLTMIEAADLARARGRDDLLAHSRSVQITQRSFPNGGHVAEVEVDPETGQVALVRYTVTDDFGTLIAPQLVEGQVHGGIAQGFGQAVTETTAHDDQGQLLTGSFMDYAMPRATDLPFVTFTTEPVPTATNPLGMKGCGEAGTVGSLGAISNAVADALAPLGVRRVDMPFTPARVWAMIEEARAGLI